MRDSIVISGSTDRTLKVWNADTGECVHTLYGHTSTVRCMHLHGNRYGRDGVWGLVCALEWGRLSCRSIRGQGQSGMGYRAGESAEVVRAWADLSSGGYSLGKLVCLGLSQMSDIQSRHNQAPSSPLPTGL